MSNECSEFKKTKILELKLEYFGNNEQKESKGGAFYFGELYSYFEV